MSNPERTLHSSIGIAAAAVGVVAMGCAPVIVKFPEVESFALALHRTWITVLLTLLLLIASGGRISRTSIRVSAAGGTALGLTVVLTFAALKLTTVANTTVILALQPVAVLLLVGRQFGETVPRAATVMTALATVGVILVVFGSSAVPEWNPTGDALALAGLGAWTWYFVASKHARRQLGTLEYHASLSTVALVVIAPMAAVSGQAFALPPLGAWPWIVGLVLFPGGGQVLMNWAHNHTSLFLVSLLTLAIPVIASLSAAVILDERLVALQLTGIAVVIGSLGVVIRSTTTANRTPAALP